MKSSLFCMARTVKLWRKLPCEFANWQKSFSLQIFITAVLFDSMGSMETVQLMLLVPAIPSVANCCMSALLISAVAALVTWCWMIAAAATMGNFDKI